MELDSRQNFGIGQEIISADLNKIAARLERGMYDYVVHQLMGRKSDAFFLDSFGASFVDSATILIKAGMGFQNITTDSAEPVNKPLFREDPVVANFDAPDASNPRIDIVVVKAALIDGETVTRKYKDAETQEISDRTFVNSTAWQAEILVVTGTAAAAPVAPAVPAGYLLIQTVLVSAATGIADQAAITDNRTLLPICTSTTTTGSNEYDAIVGSTPQSNYATLEAALTASQDGWKILVLEDESIDTGSIPTVTKNNIEIVFKSGVTFSKGTASIGLIIQGDYFKIVNGRFADFSTGGDFGIRVDGATYATITGVRYNNCDGTADNQGTNTVEVYSIEE